MGASVLHAGCADGVDSSILTGGKAPAESIPTLISPKADPAGRPAQVAFVSACANAYGFAHDPLKLKATYLSYEAKQRGMTQLAAVEQEYDSTYGSIASLSSSRQSSYCSTKHGDVVRAELRRYQSGHFEERPTGREPAFDQRTYWNAVDCGGKC